MGLLSAAIRLGLFLAGWAYLPLALVYAPVSGTAAILFLICGIVLIPASFGGMDGDRDADEGVLALWGSISMPVLFLLGIAVLPWLWMPGFLAGLGIGTTP